jgi:uncharacterized protein DUF4373
MARKPELGIKYFPQNTDHIRNNKVKLLMLDFAEKGYWIYQCLLCEVYEKKGYFMDLNDKDNLILFASDVCKKPVSLVNEVISGCVKRGLFDKDVFNMFNVLTSDRIQENWMEAKYDTARKGPQFIILEEYLLTTVIHPNFIIRSLNNHSSGNKGFNSGNLRDKSSPTGHSSVQRVEENKIKEKREDFSPPLFDDVFIFFKEKGGWDLKKAGDEADKFINHYGRTGWKTNNGDITNWQNAASGWIARDSEFGGNSPPDPKKTALIIPELPDDIFYCKLAPADRQVARDKWCAAGHRYQDTGEKSRMGWYLKDGTKVTPRE